jgi:hypothetical protein
MIGEKKSYLKIMSLMPPYDPKADKRHRVEHQHWVETICRNLNNPEGTAFGIPRNFVKDPESFCLINHIFFCYKVDTVQYSRINSDTFPLSELIGLSDEEFSMMCSLNGVEGTFSEIAFAETIFRVVPALFSRTDLIVNISLIVTSVLPERGAATSKIELGSTCIFRKKMLEFKNLPTGKLKLPFEVAPDDLFPK